jgi:hypothetical protein
MFARPSGTGNSVKLAARAGLCSAPLPERRLDDASGTLSFRRKTCRPMFDIALFVVFCVAALWIGAAIRRERAIWREFDQGMGLLLLLPLLPLAFPLSWLGGLWLPHAVVWALALLCCLPAWVIARRQREVFQRSGTSRAQAAEEAAANVGGLALLGMAALTLRIAFAVSVTLFKANL